MQYIEWLFEAQVSLPLWQEVGKDFLLLAFGGCAVYFWLVRIMPDAQAQDLVKRENAPKAWRRVIVILIGIPGFISAFFVLWAFIHALSEALKDYSFGEIPVVIQVFSALAVILVPIVFFFTRKKGA